MRGLTVRIDFRDLKRGYPPRDRRLSPRKNVDFEELKQKLYGSDGIIFASPSYGIEPTARMKNFIKDRIGMFTVYTSSFGGKYFAGISTAGGIGAKQVARHVARERLILAAREVFASSGYKGATTKAIAEKAGVAEVTLFRHFPSKKDLLIAVLKRYSSLRIFDDDFKASLTWDLRTDLIDIATRFSGMTDESTEANLVSITEAIRQREFLARYIEEQIRRDNCRELPDVELAAQGFFALFFEYSISRRVYIRKSRPIEGIIENLVDLYIQGINPEP
ncbi:MAG: TetR family transcriptional regulator [Spirochaetia bacterium]